MSYFGTAPPTTLSGERHVRKAVFPAAGLGPVSCRDQAQRRELPSRHAPIQYGVEEALASGGNNVILSRLGKKRSRTT